MEQFFKLKENGTDVRTEVLAGITTFMTMAYILIVNPLILSDAGMDFGAVFVATALAAAIGTIAMALLANYPFALAPGMGLNAFFTYYVVITLGKSWQFALTAVFIEGIIFILLTFVNAREAIFNAIPMSLKHAVGAGIGLFIAFIGLQSAGIVVSNPDTVVSLTQNLGSPNVLLALIGVIITGVLVARNTKGAILFGILSTWVLAIIAQLTGWYVVDNVNNFSVIPGSLVASIPGISSTFLKFEFSALASMDFWLVVLAFLFVDLFDTLGTLIGVSDKAGFLDEEGRLPKAKEALMADAIATTAGAILGTSTTTTYVESAAGVADGGRTGLTSMTTAALFLVALVFSPIFSSIPAFATAPALIIVGFFMIGSIAKVNFEDATEAIPAFLTLVAMPLTYSISEGIVVGVLSYTLINLFAGKAEKNNPLLYILSVLFILKYILV